MKRLLQANHFRCALILVLSMTMPLMAKELWTTYKEQTVALLPSLPGWCTKDKALLMMDLIYTNDLKTCVEIGVFAGSSFCPMVQTLRYKGVGKAYAIDAWDRDQALNGLTKSTKEYDWWRQIDFEETRLRFHLFVVKNNLQRFCKIVHDTSKQAANLFQENSIDFIHFDGNNHTQESVFQDVSLYFPKVKEDGYVLLSNPHCLQSVTALIFLLERCDILSSFSGTESFLLLRKNEAKAKGVPHLLNE